MNAFPFFYLQLTLVGLEGSTHSRCSAFVCESLLVYTHLAVETNRVSCCRCVPFHCVVPSFQKGIPLPSGVFLVVLPDFHAKTKMSERERWGLGQSTERERAEVITCFHGAPTHVSFCSHAWWYFTLRCSSWKCESSSKDF